MRDTTFKTNLHWLAINQYLHMKSQKHATVDIQEKLCMFRFTKIFETSLKHIL